LAAGFQPSEAPGAGVGFDQQDLVNLLRVVYLRRHLEVFTEDVSIGKSDIATLDYKDGPITLVFVFLKNLRLVHETIDNYLNSLLSMIGRHPSHPKHAAFANGPLASNHQSKWDGWNPHCLPAVVKEVYQMGQKP